MTAQSVKKNDGLTIKGTAGSLLIRLRENDEAYPFSELLEELERRLTEGEKFFRGTKAAFELGKRELDAAQLESLLPILQNHQIELEHIVSGSQVTRSAARQVGLTFKLPNNQNTRPAVPVDEATGVPFDNAEALLVRRTLRGGQTVSHHGDVIILGDVNPGAEVTAGGSIIVWGALRGIAQAGISEEAVPNPKAVICALQLNPPRLSIGKYITRAPEGSVTRTIPEMASVRDQALIVEAWLPAKKR